MLIQKLESPDVVRRPLLRVRQMRAPLHGGEIIIKESLCGLRSVR